MDWDRVNRNIRWIETHCRIPEGKFVGRRLVLTKEQKLWIADIYGTPTRTYILSVGRKNAKTAFAAMILLLHTAGPEYRINSQLYSAAQSKEQAAIIFKLAAKMIRMSPDLSSYIKIRDTLKMLVCPEVGIEYRALSAEVSTSFGLSPALAIHDELGQVKGPSSPLYDAIETAAAAHDSPLSLIISTQAPTDGDLLSILIDDALRGDDPLTKCRIYTAPKERLVDGKIVPVDPFCVESIRMANPHFDVFMNQDEVLSQAEKARRMPSRESSFRNLILNQRVTLHNPLVTDTVWNMNSGVPDEELFKTNPVFMAIDLSKRTDLCSMAAVTYDDEGVFHAKMWFFTPSIGLLERAHTDRVPYDKWVEKDFIIATPGATVEYDFITDELKMFSEGADIIEIAYDRFRIDVLESSLERADIVLPLKEFGQGFVSMAPAIDSVESVLINGKLRHGGHPVLKHAATCSVVTMDEAGNRKLNKAKSTGRIDGMVVLTMATHLAKVHFEDQFNAEEYSPIGTKR